MNPGLTIEDTPDRNAAQRLLSEGKGTMWVGGGTELVPLMRAGLVAPRRLVPVRRLGLDAVLLQPGSAGAQLRLGAGVTMAEAASHPLVRQHAPAVAEALRLSASPQVRHMATLGGNLLQDTRCPYWRQASPHCNRVRPGTGCAARHGEQRHAAIFGIAKRAAEAGSTDCVATHASDLAVALLALDARLVIEEKGRAREVALDAFYRLPPSPTDAAHRLGSAELITAIVLPVNAATRGARFFKVRDRASFQFALVSVALALTTEAGIVRQARVAAGGVAPRPWRLAACEAGLVGQSMASGAGSSPLQVAAEAAAHGAEVLPGNAFKIELLQRLLAHALGSMVDDVSPTLAGE